MNSLRLTVSYDRSLVEALSQVQYNATHWANRIVAIGTGVLCLLVGARFIGSIESPWNLIFALYGCLAICFVSVPAKWRAAKVCQGIESRGKGYPQTEFDFGAEGFTTNTRGNTGKGVFHRYADCHRLVETRDGLYVFISREAAYPLPFSVMDDQTHAALRALLEEKTGLVFAPLPSLLTLSMGTIQQLRRSIRR